MIYYTTVALIIYFSGIFISKNLTEVGQTFLVISLLKSLSDFYKAKEKLHNRSAFFLIFFFLIIIISTLANIEHIPRLGKYLYNIRAPLFGICLLFILPFWIKESSIQLKKQTFTVFLISILFSSSFGLYCYFVLNQSRLEGFVHIMKQGYGSALLLSVLFPLYLHRNKLKKYFPTSLLAITIIITFTAMVFTFTRGAMLGFLCSIPVSLYFYRKKWAYTAILIIGIITSIQGGYYLFGSKNTKIRFLITKENNSDNLRKSVWQSAIYAIKEKPLLGWGYLNLSPHMQEIKEKYDLPRKDFVNTHAHNNLLEITAGTGFLGLIAFITWLISWFNESRKGNYFIYILVAPFLVTFLVTGLFELTLDHRLAIILFFFYALTTSLNQIKTCSSETTQS